MTSTRGRALLVTVPVLFALMGSPAAERSERHDPTAFACDSKIFSLQDFESSPSVMSPDGKNRVRLNKDHSFRVLADEAEIARLGNDFDMSCCIEVGWAPDSKQFFISYSNGGATGGYSVRLYTTSGNHVKENSAPEVALNDFKVKHDCPSRGANVFFLSWTSDSRKVFLVTEVYPTGDCGPAMGRYRGYLMDVAGGTIVRRYGEKQTSAIEKQCRASGKLPIP